MSHEGWLRPEGAEMSRTISKMMKCLMAALVVAALVAPPPVHT